MAFWLTPSPAYIELTWAAERSFLRLFATPSELGPFGLPVVPKKKIVKLIINIHNDNYYNKFNYIYPN